MKGVDYAFSHPSIAALETAGVKFVGRYVSPRRDSTSLWQEHSPRRMRKTSSSAGMFASSSTPSRRRARWSRPRRRRRRSPSTSTPSPKRSAYPSSSYFAADWDATPAQQTGINAYLDGAALRHRPRPLRHLRRLLPRQTRTRRRESAVGGADRRLVRRPVGPAYQRPAAAHGERRRRPVRRPHLHDRRLRPMAPPVQTRAAAGAAHQVHRRRAHVAAGARARARHRPRARPVGHVHPPRRRVGRPADRATSTGKTGTRRCPPGW